MSPVGQALLFAELRVKLSQVHSWKNAADFRGTSPAGQDLFLVYSISPWFIKTRDVRSTPKTVRSDRMRSRLTALSSCRSTGSARLAGQPGPRLDKACANGANPEQLRALPEWLISQHVEEAVMESTAQYWKPVWEALERYGNRDVKVRQVRVECLERSTSSGAQIDIPLRLRHQRQLQPVSSYAHRFPLSDTA